MIVWRTIIVWWYYLFIRWFDDDSMMIQSLILSMMMIFIRFYSLMIIRIRFTITFDHSSFHYSILTYWFVIRSDTFIIVWWYSIFIIHYSLLMTYYSTERRSDTIILMIYGSIHLPCSMEKPDITYSFRAYLIRYILFYRRILLCQRKHYSVSSVLTFVSILTSIYLSTFGDTLFIYWHSLFCCYSIHSFVIIWWWAWSLLFWWYIVRYIYSNHYWLLTYHSWFVLMEIVFNLMLF